VAETVGKGLSGEIARMKQRASIHPFPTFQREIYFCASFRAVTITRKDARNEPCLKRFVDESEARNSGQIMHASHFAHTSREKPECLVHGLWSDSNGVAEGSGERIIVEDVFIPTDGRGRNYLLTTPLVYVVIDEFAAKILFY